MEEFAQRILKTRLASLSDSLSDDGFKRSVLPAGNPFELESASFYVPSGMEEIVIDVITKSAHKLLLVTGCAGCGKTTLVDYVLRSHLSKHAPQFYAATSQAKLSGRTIPPESHSKDLLDFVNNQLRQSLPTSSTVNSMLFYDGLDETAPTSISAALDSCTDFLKGNPKAKVVMTSRPYSLDAHFTEKGGFRGFGYHKLDLSASIIGKEPVVELYTGLEPPIELVSVVKSINAELIRALKAQPATVQDISPRAFEELIAEILAFYGWGIHITSETKDGGYDIYAISKDISGASTSWVIECKRYKQERKVGVDIARSLYAVKGDLRVANAMIATTSFFTSGVEDFKNSRYEILGSHLNY